MLWNRLQTFPFVCQIPVFIPFNPFEFQCIFVIFFPQLRKWIETHLGYKWPQTTIASVQNIHHIYRIIDKLLINVYYTLAVVRVRIAFDWMPIASRLRGTSPSLRKLHVNEWYSCRKRKTFMRWDGVNGAHKAHVGPKKDWTKTSSCRGHFSCCGKE